MTRETSNLAAALTSQIRTAFLLGPAPASRRLSGEYAIACTAEAAPGCAARAARWRDSRCESTNPRSFPRPRRVVPSGAKAMNITEAECPLKVSRSRPSARSHMRMSGEYVSRDGQGPPRRRDLQITHRTRRKLLELLPLPSSRVPQDDGPLGPADGDIPAIGRKGDGLRAALELECVCRTPTVRVLPQRRLPKLIYRRHGPRIGAGTPGSQWGPMKCPGGIGTAVVPAIIGTTKARERRSRCQQETDAIPVAVPRKVCDATPSPRFCSIATAGCIGRVVSFRIDLLLIAGRHWRQKAAPHTQTR